MAEEIRTLEPAAARAIAVRASLLTRDANLPAGKVGLEAVIRHFGSVQLDPTRTVERTHYLVPWSRLGNYDRDELDQLLWHERRFIEHNAFIVPIERVPELYYEATPWLGNWRDVRNWLEVNRAFRQSILDQLRDRGPLQSRDIDDSTVVEGWRSTGWTYGRNTTRMLEFMGRGMEVVVSGRVGQERLWDLPERVIPADAPTQRLTDDEYAERRVELALRRFGFADLRDIKQRAYWVPKSVLPKAIERMVEDGRLTPIASPYEGLKRPAWATPDAVEAADSQVRSRTTLLSPFDPLIYDRERTLGLFDFEYKLEMYVPKEERKFGHFTLPVLYDNRLVGRLDSAVDRKRRVLVVNRLHWECEPDAAMRSSVDEALAELAVFVGATAVSRD